jgi:hypothetical protein
MRVLYEPTTLVALAATMQVAGGFMNANAAKSNAQANAGYIDAEINQEKVQSQRDQADLKTKTDQAQGRALAMLAAGGGDPEGGTGLALLEDNSEASAITGSRMKVDSNNRIASLTARAANTLLLGKQQANAAIFSGVGSAAGTVGQYSLLKSTPKVSPKITWNNPGRYDMSTPWSP